MMLLVAALSAVAATPPALSYLALVEKVHSKQRGGRRVPD